MAGDGMADGDYDDDDMYEWDYIEDTYPLADELAETSVADPGYTGSAGELSMQFYEFDLYEYWDDLEYGDDSYWEYNGASGDKRTRVEGARRPAPKRRKRSLKETEGGNVKFVRMSARRAAWSQKAAERRDLKQFALLPDWRERCAGADLSTQTKAMPKEMKQAAEGTYDDSPDMARHFDAKEVDGEEDGWEDEEEDEEAGDLQAQLANLDPEMLKAVLRSKLGDAGLESMDEGALMATLGKMLSGDDGAEDAMGELADSMVGQATQDEGSALSGWLSQQGVSLDKAEDGDDDETGSVMTVDAKEGDAAPMLVSPHDSGVEVLKNRQSTEMAVHSDSPNLTVKKRMAPTDSLEQKGSVKRKKVTFDVPSSQPEETKEDEGENGTDVNTVVPDGELVTDELPDGEPEPSISTKRTRTSKKALRSKSMPTQKQGADTSTAKPALASKADNPPAKSTRKRKADAEDEDKTAPPPKKKQAGNAAEAEAGAEAGPGFMRPTRATRARSGK